MLLLFLLIIQLVNGQNRNPSNPYISGDTFRAACDFIYDETSDAFFLQKCRYGSTFFVKIDYLAQFFRKVHPKIRFPYVLVTHNGDNPAPGMGLPFLDDPKILAWYAQNVEVQHPKLHPIPIGLANRYWPHGNPDLLTDVRQHPSEKVHLLYLNFTPGTFPTERQRVYDLFHKVSYCHTQATKPYGAYLQDVAASKFVLSPRGNGLDCHRTWEALWLGSIPVLKTSMLDPLLEGLPVLIVQEWTEVTEQLLKKKWAEHLVTHYDREKLYFDYWLQQINQYK